MGPQIAYSGSASTLIANALIAPSSLATNADGVSYVLANSKEAFETLPNGTHIDNDFLTGQAAIALDHAGTLLGLSANPSPVSLSVLYGPYSPGSVPRKICDTPLDSVSAFAHDSYDGNYYAASGTGSSYPGLIRVGVKSDLLNNIFCSWTPLSAILVSPTQIAFDASGDVYVADGSQGVVKLNSLGVQSVVAAGSGAAGVAVDAAGDLYYSDMSGKVYELPAGGEPLLIDTPGAATNISLDGAGNLYTISYISPTVGTVVRVNRASPPTLTFAQTNAGAVSADSPKTTIIQNTGNTPLTIASVVYPPDFPEAGGPNLCAASTSLAPGQMCNVTVKFAPRSTGAWNEQVTITDNSLNVKGAQQQIGVSGQSILSAQTISFTPPSTVAYGVSPIDLSKGAKASSGLPVAFHVVSGPATLQGAILSITGAGSVVLQASQVGGGIYAAAQSVNKTITVSQAFLYVTANAASKVYGAAMPTLTASCTGFVNGDTAATALTGTPALTTVATAIYNVGNYAITAAAGTLAAANYTFKFVSGALTITPAVLTVTAGNRTAIYGAAIPTLGYIFTGFVNGDLAVHAVTGAPSLTTAAQGSAAGTYAIVPALGTLGARDYTFTFVDGTLTITKVLLTVTASSPSKVYGAAMPALTASYTGFVNGDTAATALTGSPALTTVATAIYNVGSYAITTAVGTLAAASYTFKFAPGTLTVTPAVLTVTAGNRSKVVGAALPSLGYAIAGFVNGDLQVHAVTGVPALTTTATQASQVGTYPITVALGTLAARDYTFTFVDGTLTVTTVVTAAKP